MQGTIRKFNEFYRLPANDKPTLLPIQTLLNFKSMLKEELDEIDVIVEKYKKLASEYAESHGVSEEELTKKEWDKILKDDHKAEILAEVAESVGYRVVSIDLFRTRLATATKEQLREEVVILQWPGGV